MSINISELISTPFKEETFEVPIDMEAYESMGDKFPFRKKENLVLTVSNIGTRKIHLKGHWQGELGIPCDRCLEEVAVPLAVEIDEDIDLSSEDSDEDADNSYIEESNIDTDALINHEILIRFPMKTLCRKNCKGICLKCGKNLNLGECGCDRTSLDPRMAAIQDIFKNFKEV
ncbi:MAG: DUF177 domain-containing protein [Lachnospiraceae bacterium]|nr:DUF177 domain-containing protein [Lachnospiraceae bacterium]